MHITQVTQEVSYTRVFYYRTIHIWNTLEFNTRNTADIVEFKRATKRHLWDRILDRI